MKNFLKYTGIVLVLAIAGCYFFFAEILCKNASKDEICRNIKVVILDSAQNRFVDANDITSILNTYFGKVEGVENKNINLENIEELLNKRTMVRNAEACLNIMGEMLINITQRRPIIRIESSNGGFYIDDSKYIFPLSENYTSYVPVVSGHIPIEFYKDYRGNAMPEMEKWINGIYNLGIFIDEHPFWNAQIEQIYIDSKGDIYIAPRVGNQKIIFGDLNNIENKFAKLNAFYENVIPSVGWNMYDKINLKYKDQIVCTKKKQSKNS